MARARRTENAPPELTISERATTATTHAQAGDWSAAASALVDAWRACRHPDIAALVIAIDRHAKTPGIVAGTVKQREEAWHALATEPDEAVVATLLATPWPTFPAEAVARVERLLDERPPSPRISHELVALVARRQYPSAAGRVLHRRIFRTLFKQQDPIVTRYLAGLDAAANRAALAELGALAKKQRPPLPALDAATTQALATIAALVEPAAKHSADREALLAAVHATPLDDGPREVLADALIEAGDPRGEFIALQLRRHRGEPMSPKLASRERALLRAAGNRWYDGIDADGAREIELARGFPIKAQTEHARFTAAGWATVETLLVIPRDTVRFAGAPTLVGLRHLYGVPGQHLATAVLPNPAQLEDIAPHGLVGLTRETPFAPTSFGIDEPHDNFAITARNVVKLPIGKHVTHFHTALSIDALVDACAILRELPQITRVTVLGTYQRIYPAALVWSAEVTRDHLRLRWSGGRTADHRARDALNVLVKPPFRTIELVAADPTQLTRAHKVIGDVAKRWGAVLAPI